MDDRGGKRKRKRQKQRPHSFTSSSSSKRLRHQLGDDDNHYDNNNNITLPYSSPTPPSSSSSSSSSFVMVIGLPADCSVLELKSQLEQMFGTISRARIDSEDGAGYVTFRSHLSADAAVAASPVHFPFSSAKVVLCKATDPLPRRRTGAEASAPSKLLRPEIPLSKHGRSNKKLTESTTSTKNAMDLPFKGRQIVAYDDLF